MHNYRLGVMNDSVYRSRHQYAVGGSIGRKWWRLLLNNLAATTAPAAGCGEQAREGGVCADIRVEALSLNKRTTRYRNRPLCFIEETPGELRANFQRNAKKSGTSYRRKELYARSH